MISRSVGRFAWDLRFIRLLIFLGAILAGSVWVVRHPQHNPYAPLDLREPIGWATSLKLQQLQRNPTLCHATFERSNVAFRILSSPEIVVAESADAEPCAQPDRVVLPDFDTRPAEPVATCAIMAATYLWEQQIVQPAARAAFKEDVTTINHFGTYSCRRINNAADGAWSEHATGNAIDIAGFQTASGRQISILEGWDGDEAEKRFLRTVRDGACRLFSTTLSPDYNRAHADHFHLDQTSRYRGMCR